MKKEQSSLNRPECDIWYCEELIKEKPENNGKSIFDYFEVIELTTHKRILADQKAKMIEMFIEEFNDDIYTSTRLERKWDNLKKKFEELIK